LNAAASSPSEIVTWLAIITAVFLVLFWFFNVFQYQKPAFEEIDSDLVTLNNTIVTACDSYYYKKELNLNTESGTLIYDDTNKLCIISTGIERCKSVMCELKKFELDLNAQKVIVLQENGEVRVYAE
jgi:hypothetical protein